MKKPRQRDAIAQRRNALLDREVATLRMTPAAYARYRNVHRSTVTRAVRSGRIALGPDGKIPVAQADAAWTRNTTQRVSSGDGETDADYHRERARREKWNAKKAELDYRERTGKLVDAESVKAAWVTICIRVRDRVLEIPHRIAPALAAETDPLKVQSVLLDECEKALRELSR